MHRSQRHTGCPIILAQSAVVPDWGSTSAPIGAWRCNSLQTDQPTNEPTDRHMRVQLEVTLPITSLCIYLQTGWARSRLASLAAPASTRWINWRNRGEIQGFFSDSIPRLHIAARDLQSLSLFAGNFLHGYNDCKILAKKIREVRRLFREQFLFIRELSANKLRQKRER